MLMFGVVCHVLAPVLIALSMEGSTLFQRLAMIGYVVGVYLTELQQFTTALAQIRTGVSDFTVVREFLERPNAVGDRRGAMELAPGTSPAIEFKNVTFSYGERAILQDVSFKVDAGSRLGVVGSSGCGKSTIMKLLLRFYAPTSGAIYVNGQDIYSLTAESLRGLFSVVTQDAQLFRDSIRENIGYGKEGATQAEIEEAEDLKRPKKEKSARCKEEEDAKRAAKRALAHIWSKTERMNCERAMLSFGLGRWSRVREAAQGGTKLRTDAEVEAFGIAFVCLCVGVPVGPIGVIGAKPPADGAALSDRELGECKGLAAGVADGVLAAREILAEIKCPLPRLTLEQGTELEPLVRAGGAEYAERVHKLGASLLARLLALKRLSDSIERCADPLRQYKAPDVHGGVGRDMNVRWTRRDDALLLLGVYKHGYRAYEEVRDDPELPFTCRLPRAPLPALLPQVAPNETSTAAGAFDCGDVLPVPPAGPDAAAQLARETPSLAVRTDPPPPPPAEGEEPKGAPDTRFLAEKEYRERQRALMEALEVQERERDQVLAWEGEWEDSWAREMRGEAPTSLKKASRAQRNQEADAAALRQVWEVCAMDAELM